MPPLPVALARELRLALAPFFALTPGVLILLYCFFFTKGIEYVAHFDEKSDTVQG